MTDPKLSVDPDVEMFRKAYNIQEPVKQPVEEQKTEVPTEATKEVEAPAAPDNVPPVDTAVSEVSILKDLGFESIDALKEALNKQPEPKQPEFANETSKQLYELILQGKENDIADVLYTRKQVQSLLGETDETKLIKAYIGFKNPEFDRSDIEAEYNELYTIPENAEFDDAKRTREEKRLRQRIKSDVAAAKEYFNKKSEELTLPTVAKNTIEPDEELDNESAVYRQRFVDSLQKFGGVKPIEFEYKDENTSVPIKYELDAHGVQEIKSLLEKENGFFDFFADRHYDGKEYKIDQMVKDFYVLKNFDKILDSAVSQAVNKAKIEYLKTQKNIQDNPSDRALPQELEQDSKKEMLKKLFF